MTASIPSPCRFERRSTPCCWCLYSIAMATAVVVYAAGGSDLIPETCVTSWDKVVGTGEGGSGFGLTGADFLGLVTFCSAGGPGKRSRMRATEPSPVSTVPS